MAGLKKNPKPKYLIIGSFGPLGFSRVVDGFYSGFGLWVAVPIGPKVVPYWDYLIEF